MNKILLILLVGLSANTAMASRARLTALGQSNYSPAADLAGVGYTSDGTLLFKDNRNIFLNPGQISSMGNSFNFEFGPKTPTSATNGEGGMIYDLDGGKLGFQLGRQNDINKTIVALGYGTPPGNNVDIIYGQKGWGVGLHYGNAKTDAAATPASASASHLIFSGGLVKDKAEYYAHVAVDANAETNATNKFEGKSYIRAGMGYQLDNVAKVIAEVSKNGFDNTAGGAKTEYNYLDVDVRYNRLQKPKTDLMFFYGAGFKITTGDRTTTGTKSDITVQQIPLFLGLEGSANSWMDLRASVTQMVLIDTIKNPNIVTSGETQHRPNTTTVGAGATLKFTNFIVDATLAGASTGAVNGTSLLADASLIYNF